MTKRNWIVAGGIGAIVVAALLGALYFLLWAPPTKDDFKAAYNEADSIKDIQVSAPLNKYATAVIEQREAGKSYKELTTSLKADREKIVSNLDQRADKMKKLESSKALRDDEVKKAYDTYVAKETKFANYTRAYAEAFPLYDASFEACIDAFEVSKRTLAAIGLAKLHKEAIKDCFVILDKLSAIKDMKPFSDYAKEFKRILNDRQKVFDEVANEKRTPDSASAAIKKSAEDVKHNNPNEAFKRLKEASTFNGELNALIDILKKKAEA